AHLDGRQMRLLTVAEYDQLRQLFETYATIIRAKRVRFNVGTETWLRGRGRAHMWSRALKALYRMLRWLFGSDDDGCAGVFAKLKPRPPTLQARAAKRPPPAEGTRKSA